MKKFFFAVNWLYGLGNLFAVLCAGFLAVVGSVTLFMAMVALYHYDHRLTIGIIIAIVYLYKFNNWENQLKKETR